MVDTSWVRRISLGLATVGAVAVIATTTLGARDRPWVPALCTSEDGVTLATGPRAPGTWWRMDPRMADGRVVGQQLALGGPGQARPRRMDLASEAFAAGPFDGRVLVGIDDGRRSRLSLVDPARGCSREIGTSTSVIRRATLAPDRTAIIEFRVDRETRADLGVFRRPLDDRERTTRLLEPIAPDARFGRTWTTEFEWSVDERMLAVQSCGAHACRTRVLDLRDGSVHLVSDPSQGDIVGLADGRLVVHEACGGMPCAVVAVDLDGGDPVTIDPAAWQAVVATGPGGRPTVVVETGRDGLALRTVGLDGRGGRTLAPDPTGRRLIAGPARSGGAAEVAPGHVLLGPGGSLPVDGPSTPALRRLADDVTFELNEVLR